MANPTIFQRLGVGGPKRVTQPPAQVAILPFNQYNWPNPKLPVRTNALNTASWNFGPTQQANGAKGGVFTNWDRIESFPIPKQAHVSFFDPGKLLAPFVQTDWPVPKAPKQPTISYTQTNAFMVEPKIELLTMGRNYDLPIPPYQFQRGTKFVTSAFQVEPKIELLTMGRSFALGAAPPAPVVQSWSQNLLETTLTPADGLPFGYISWTAPQAPLQFVRGRAVSFGPDKLANGAVGGVYTNWDRIENYPIVQQTQPQVNMLPLTAPAVVAPTPFNQYDWPLPTRAVQIAQNGNAGLNIPLNDFIPVFPNSIGIPDVAPYPSSLRTWSQTSAFIPVAVANQVGVFFTAWGIPDAPFYSVPRGWAVNLLETTLSVVTPPDPTPTQRDGDGVKRRGVKPLPFIRPKVERDLDDVLEIVNEASDTRRASDNRKTIKAAIAKLQEVNPPPDYAAPIAAISQALRNVSRATAKHQGMQEAVARIVAELDAVIRAMETERKAAEAEREVKAQARRYRDNRDLEALAWLLS